MTPRKPRRAGKAAGAKGAAAAGPRLLPGQPHDADGPVFSEPWEAQAFALAVRLHEQGAFTWKEWTETLGAQFAAAKARGEPDDGARYYEHWLAALERLVTAKGLLQPEAMRRRRDAWEQAYLATPHGQPVHLQGDDPA